MINRIVLSIIIATTLWSSCGNANDKSPEELIRTKSEKIEELQAEISEIQLDIKNLQNEIIALGGSIEKKPDTALITTVMAEVKDFEKYIKLPGSISSKQNITISSEMGGVITQVHVAEGQNVKAGEILAEHDVSVLQNTIEEINTSLSLATTIYEKRKKLWEQNIGSEVDFLQAKNNKESLERKLATTQAQLDKAYVTAPFNGVVDELFINKGEMAAPGQPLIRLVNLGSVQLEADVPETYLGKISRGEKVEVEVPSLGRSMVATVRSVGQTIDPNNRTFKIEMNINNSDGMLRPNLVANVYLKETVKNEQVVVPTYLVQRSDEGDFIFTVEEGKVVKRLIKTGDSFRGETVILKGLQGDEKLVDRGFRNVFEGMVAIDNEQVITAK